MVCISVSYEQMIPLMKKIWDLAPKNEIDPRNGFEPGRGIIGKPPRIVYTSGPGKGSVISFATYSAGARRIAGNTLDYLGCDEPPDEEIYGEALPRVMRQRGLIRVTMTPTPDMPDQTWLLERVKAGLTREVNFGTEEKYCWPAGYPQPWIRQSEIDVYARSLLPHEREMRLKGAWYALTTGRWLEHFDTKNIGTFSLSDLAGWYLGIGMDHGTPGGKQTAVLIAAKDRATDRPKVRVMDERVNEGLTKPEDDAASVLDMIVSNGLRYDDVDFFVGDVPTESKLHSIRKSNLEIRREIAKQLGRRVENTKDIPTPRKFSDSLRHGIRLMDTLCDRGDLIVHERCKAFQEACWNFKGDPKDPVKDVLDGGRYPIERAITGIVVPTLSARY